MDFGLGTYSLSLAAGMLSTLSPCVLPLLPLLLGTAVAAHRLGPVALAGGLALSFAGIGLLLATFGVALDLDPGVFRSLAAVLLMIFGVLLLSERLQQGFATLTAGLSNVGNGLLLKMRVDGLPGQFLLGLLLGLVWTPCTGPTLGAVVTLASQGKDLAQVTLSLALFGIGAGLPLIALGLASRQAIGRMRGRLLKAGMFGKQALGGLLLAFGLLILSGADKLFEAWVLERAPAWLIGLTTAI